MPLAHQSVVWGACSLACQEQNAPMRFRGAGMPPGEPCEQNNAELKGCAALTKYNTRTRRQAGSLMQNLRTACSNSAGRARL